jgi:hypothetical protein
MVWRDPATCARTVPQRIAGSSPAVTVASSPQMTSTLRPLVLEVVSKCRRQAKNRLLDSIVPVSFQVEFVWPNVFQPHETICVLGVHRRSSSAIKYFLASCRQQDSPPKYNDYTRYQKCLGHCGPRRLSGRRPGMTKWVQVCRRSSRSQIVIPPQLAVAAEHQASPALTPSTPPPA